MLYKLPDGKIIELSRIRSVSSVRDYGADSRYIDLSNVGFTIHLDNREIIDIKENYHFNDWGEAKRKLQQLRNDILSKWKEESK